MHFAIPRWKYENWCPPVSIFFTSFSSATSHAFYIEKKKKKKKKKKTELHGLSPASFAARIQVQNM